MRTCPHCSASDLPDVAAVCGYCGTRLEAAPPDPVPAPSPTPAPNVPSSPTSHQSHVAPAPGEFSSSERSVEWSDLDRAGLFALVALAASAFMPWVNSPFTSITPMSEIPLSILWDPFAYGGPNLGLLILGLAVLGLVGLFKTSRAAVALVGLGSLITAGLFVFQAVGGTRTWRSTPPVSDILEFFSFGTYVCAVAGVAVVWSTFRLRRS